MRELKFRAWNHIVKRMSDCYTIQEFHKEKVNFTNITIMQFTGLKDKNGDDIYEGDIIESKTLMNNQKINGKVLFSESGMWMVEEIHPVHNEREYLFELTKWPDRTGVVGNIYQNPELIPNPLTTSSNE